MYECDHRDDIIATGGCELPHKPARCVPGQAVMFRSVKEYSTGIRRCDHVVSHLSGDCQHQPHSGYALNGQH